MKNLVLKSLLVVSLVSIVAVADDEIEVTSSIQVPEHTTELNEQKSAKIGVARVVEVLQANYANGKIVSVELENEDGNLIYEAQILQGDQVTEVIVDAGDGKILATSIDEEDEAWYRFW